MSRVRTIVAVAVMCGTGLAGYRLGVAQSATPADIFADSGARVPMVKRDDLDEVGKKMFDQANGDGNSIVGLRGPGGLRLYSPLLDEYTRQTNQYLRFKSGIDPRTREIACMVTAREMDQRFEWYAHELEGRKVGVPENVIEAIKNRRPTTGLDPRDAAIVRLGREALGAHNVSSATFAEISKYFGRKDLMNLVGLMGDYAGTSVLLTTFNQQLPDGKISDLPIPVR
jgi:4-carboxymuconolactone decarboxylase